MSATNEQVTLKRLELDIRRQRIRQHRRALREDARQYCARPSTLGAAVLSGFVLGRLLPPLVSSRYPQQPLRPAKLLDPYLQMIPMLVFERVRHSLICRERMRNSRQNTEENTEQLRSALNNL